MDAAPAVSPMRFGGLLPVISPVTCAIGGGLVANLLGGVGLGWIGWSIGTRP